MREGIALLEAALKIRGPTRSIRLPRYRLKIFFLKIVSKRKRLSMMSESKDANVAFQRIRIQGKWVVDKGIA